MSSPDLVGVVLAAGKGMRLRPATELCPKPLIPVAGIEPLFFAIEKYYQAGIRKIVVNTHYLHEQIEDSLNMWASHFPGAEIRLSYEANILGTGGALHKILAENGDWFEECSMLVQNGDTVSAFDLQVFVEENSKNCFAISRVEEHLEKYNTLWIDQEGLWAGIGKEAQGSDWRSAHFLGTHHLSNRALKILQTHLEPDRENDLFNAIYRPLVDRGESISSVEFFQNAEKEDFWFDMTNQEFFLEAQTYILQNCLDSFWGRYLKRRYPQIQSNDSHVWSSCSEILNRANVLGPSIIVLDPDSATLEKMDKLGPCFCWIEQAQVSLEGWVPGRLESSTVYVHAKTTLTKEGLNNDILDQVVVL